MAQDRFIFDGTQGMPLGVRCSAIETLSIEERTPGAFWIRARPANGDTVFLAGSHATLEEATEAMELAADQILQCRN